MNSNDVVPVLRRFAPILWRGLQHPTRSWDKHGSSVANKWVYDGEFGSTVPLWKDEVARWDAMYDIHARMAKHQSKLFVPSGINAPGKKVRVNLKDITYQPVESVRSLQGLSFHMSTHAYIGFSGSQPYNAFIGQDVFAQDSQGRWLFDVIPGSTNDSVYGRYYVARASCWFNLKVDPTTSNSMSLGFSGEDDLMLKVQLHHMPQTSEEFILDATDSIKQRADFFFWEVKQFMFPTALWRVRWPMM